VDRLLLACLLVLALSSALPGTANGQTMQPTNLAAPAPASEQPEPAPSSSSGQPGPAVSESVRRLQYTLSLNVGEIYDNNITLAPTNEMDDAYTRIAPAISVGFGDTLGRAENFFELNYQAAILLFVKETQFNDVNHVGHLAGQYHFSRLTIGASQDIELVQTGDSQLPGLGGTFVNGVNLDTGGRRKIDTYTSHATASYDLTGKMFLSSGADYAIVNYPSGFNDSKRLTGNLFLNYNYSERIVVGFGGTGGRDFLQQGIGDETSEQANVRASYTLTGKLTASGSAGVEFRQYDSGSGDSVSPVFDLTMSYTPGDSTSFSLQASRRTLNSAGLVGQDYNSTQVQLSVQQRMLQRIFFSVTGGYQNLDYVNAPAGTPARQDNYYFVQPAMDVRITRFWFAGVFFGYRNNDSNVFTSEFRDEQAGVHTTLRF
jgi:hypothetical protein